MSLEELHGSYAVAKADFAPYVPVLLGVYAQPLWMALMKAFGQAIHFVAHLPEVAHDFLVAVEFRECDVDVHVQIVLIFGAPVLDAFILLRQDLFHSRDLGFC
jgi:hypothetical protein